MNVAPDYANIEHLGCYSDYAYIVPEYQDAKYYRYSTDDEPTTITLSSKPPQIVNSSARLPNVDKTQYSHYGDGPTRLIPSIDGEPPDKDLPVSKAINRCYRMAKVQGKEYFALQDGLCMATNDKSVLDPKLKHGNCELKKGKPWINSVFHIKDMSAPEYMPPLAKRLEPFTYSEPIVEASMKCPQKKHDAKGKEIVEFFPLNQGQQYMKLVFRPETPQKGMLLAKSPGSGKTCEAVNMMSNFFQSREEKKENPSANWRIVWITRKTLKGIVDEELYKNICVQSVRDAIGDPQDPINKPGTPLEYSDKRALATSPQEKIDLIRGKQVNQLLAHQFGMDLPFTRRFSYNGFVKLLMRKTSQNKEMYTEFTKNANGDFGYQTLFIIDEAHNWTNPLLEETEREWLDLKLDKPITISNKTFFHRKDVYPKDPKPHKVLRGRDLLTAMVHRSYELSGASSCKSIIVTATPDMIFTLNLFQTQADLLLPTDLSAYYDKLTLQMTDVAIAGFARAAHGHIAYLDTSKDPSSFPRKIFHDAIQVPMFDFHYDILVKRPIEKTDDLVRAWTNLSLCAQLSGPVYTLEQVQIFHDMKQRLDQWNEVDAKQQLIHEYNSTISTIRQELGLVPLAKDIKRYETLVHSYKKSHKMSSAYSFKDGVKKSHGLKKLKKKSHGLKKAHESHKSHESNESRKLKKSHGLKVHKKHKVHKKLKESNGQKKSHGQKKHKKLKESNGLKKPKVHKKSHDLKKPKESKESNTNEIIGPDGKLLTLEQWFDIFIAPSRTPKQPKKSDTRLTPYIMNDPASNRTRVKTLEEFITTQLTKPTLTMGEPKDKDFQFLLWQSKFQVDKMKALLPLYAPCIHALIQTIIHLEKESVKQFGHGFKHCVFTFAEHKSGEFRKYGSPIILSAFAAYPELFEIMVAYKDEQVLDENGKPVKNAEGNIKTKKTLTDNNHRNVWGVTCLSSSPIPAEKIPNNTHSVPKEIDYSQRNIQDATMDAFNGKTKTIGKNVFGEKIKIIILDAGFQEGVSLEDVGFIHFLPNAGSDANKFTQGAARVARNCKSTHLPFFRNVGAFLDMYVYELVHNGERMYQSMLNRIDFQEKVQWNMSQQFYKLGSELAIDYWLNRAIHEATQLYKGEVVDNSREHYYTIRLNAEYNDNGKLGKLHSDFLVPNEYIDTKWRPGDVYIDWATKDKGIVPKDATPSPSWRFPLRFHVVFRIPDGVDLGTKVLNLGDVERAVLKPIAETVLTEEHWLNLPSEQLKLSWFSSTRYFLLGLLNLMQMINRIDNRVDMNIVLPPQRLYHLEPDVYLYGMVWHCNGPTHELKYDPVVLSEFLQQKSGLSFLIVQLQSVVCDTSKPSLPDDSETQWNLLIYVPEWKTIERLDPHGRRFHMFETVALDAKLSDLFRRINPALRYLCLSETALLHTRQKDLGFGSAFTLLYIYARVLWFARIQTKKGAEVSSSHFFPMQFQRTLMRSFKKNEMADVLNTFATQLSLVRDALIQSPTYNKTLPFWSNVVMELRRITLEPREPDENAQTWASAFFQKFS